MGRIIFISCLFLLSSFSLLAQDWKLARDEEDVQVYTRKVDDSPFKAFKTEMIVETTMEKIYAVTKDVPAMKTWVATTSVSDLLEKKSEDEFIVYMVNDSPWPVKDRDNIVRIVHEIKSDGSLHVKMTAIPDHIPEEKGIIRIPKMTGHWEFLPLEDGKVKVIQTGHFDLGGGMPAWMANIAVVDPPFVTMRDLRKLLQLG